MYKKRFYPKPGRKKIFKRHKNVARKKRGYTKRSYKVSRGGIRL